MAADLIHVAGLSALERAMTSLTPKAARRALNAALMAGARIIVKEAKIRAPRRTGELRRNIVARQAPRGRAESSAAVHIGVRQQAFYFQFHELGTRRIPAKPFLRPALDAAREPALAKIAERLGQRIEIELTRG